MYHNQSTQVTPALLREAIQGKLASIANYKLLYDMTEDPQDIELIRSIHNDEVAHFDGLASLYRQLTEAAPPYPQSPAASFSSFGEGVRQLIPAELKSSEFFRGIALNCDNPSRPLFSGIAADDNNHAGWLNYLYLKELESCCQGSPEPEAPTCGHIAHAVQAGDSLWAIGAKYAVSVEELLAANPQINDPGNIYAGQVLCIPCSGTSYTMQPGDSLWLIAGRHGLTVEDLVAANPFLTDPTNIGVGQVLCIPCCNGAPAPAAPRESLTYLYGGAASRYLNLLADTEDSITVACPDFFEIDESGNLLLAASEKLNPGFIKALHDQDIQVTPFLSNHWNRERAVAALTNRRQLTSQLADAVEQYGLDGVNIDIENLTHEYRNVYVDLVRMLREKLPPGKTLSVAVAANPNGWDTGWHGSYNYKALSDYCDYLVVMAYDESYQGGPEGPVSGAAFFERSIQYALNQGVPKEQLMAGIPFFGRYWKEGEATGGYGLADRDVESLLENYASSQGYDEAAQSAFATVTIRPGEPEPQLWGGRTLSPGVYHIWYDDPRATRYKLETIRRYDLLGAASWALGQEIPAVWADYSAILNG